MAQETGHTAEASVGEMVATLGEVRDEIGRVVVGHQRVIEETLVALLCGGHVLVEGVPGLGKTLLVKTIARVMGLSYARVQFTPDLMPADITGTNVLMQDEAGRRSFTFQPGPIFHQVVLADEINRATPKTQSALLEAMQEHRVTVAGNEHALPEPFLVLATQNPIEMEGTYPLPEAQVDRFFFKVTVDYPSLEELGEIVDRTTGSTVPQARPVLSPAAVLHAQALVREVPIANHVKDLALRLIAATHPASPQAPPRIARYVRYGASPRAAQAVVLGAKARALLHGRYNASGEDVQAVALPGLRHRLLLNFEGEAEGITSAELVADVLDHVAKAAA